MTAGERGLPPGVRPLDHTADVGIEVRAGSLDRLFHRAALGMLALIRGDEDEAPRSAAPAAPGARPERLQSDGRRAAAEPVAREIALHADDAPALLALWLRELLFLHEVHGFDYRSAEFDALDERRLTAVVHADPEPPPPVRELKGVTYHGLEAARTAGGGWHARVIFDV